MACPYVIVAGPVGAGKSTLTAGLAAGLDLTPFFESSGEGPDANPFLARFYDSAARRRWALASQMFFLAQAVDQQHRIAGLTGGAIQDRSSFEHLGIFAADLHRAGMLDDDEHTLLHAMAAAATRSLPAPDLLIYLHATPELLQERIRARGRAYEIASLEQDPDYHRAHCASYDPWVASFDVCPVLRVDAAQVDPQKLAPVIAQVRDTLAAAVR